MRRSRPLDPPHNPIAPPKALAADWDRKLRQSEFRDIEYRDGSLLGISMQEVARAPTQDEMDGVRELGSRDAEFLGATDWRGRGRQKRVWADYCESHTMREISERRHVALTTVHRTLEKLRKEAEQWWKDSEAERHRPRAPMGRPRREEPRRLAVTIRLSDNENRIIEAALRRAGAERCHDRRAWCRWALLQAAYAQPHAAKSGMWQKRAL